MMSICYEALTSVFVRESNQGNQGFSGNQKNVIQGQTPDMENRHAQQRTQSN